ncbi:MAG: alternative ribosome rescue aminoacyl-tRNA hydrolase ArfB, partial [Pseudobdellovibrio sp.]
MKFIIPWNEVEITATRSSGAGGQHVNRTNSAVQMRFSIGNSLVLTEQQKFRLRHKLASRLVQQDEILIRIEDERDQKSNKERAFKLLNEMILEALKEPKKRIATKPKRSAIKKRLESKKIRSEIKKNRSEKW